MDYYRHGKYSEKLPILFQNCIRSFCTNSNFPSQGLWSSYLVNVSSKILGYIQAYANEFWNTWASIVTSGSCSLIGSGRKKLEIPTVHLRMASYIMISSLPLRSGTKITRPIQISDWSVILFFLLIASVDVSN